MNKIEVLNQQQNNDCILCGDSVHKLREPINTHCDFCGKVKMTTHECQSSHFLCDECFNMPVFDFIKSTCKNYTGIDPIALAVELMNSPVVRIHGTEHHFIVPAVLITCINNLKEHPEDITAKLEEAEKRAINETSDVCTYHSGICGAALGTGIFLSIMLDREAKHEDEWSLNNMLISDVLKKMAEHGGPRCCKRDTYFSLLSAVDYLNDRFAFNLPKSEAKCTFSLRNKTCGMEDCVFYNISNSLV